MRAKLFLLLLVLGVPFVSASGMEVLPNCYDDLSDLFSTYNLQHDAGAICSPVIGNVVKISKPLVASSAGQQNTLYLPTPLLQDLIAREQISCADPTAITIAWLNLETGKWNEIHSDAQELAPGLFTVVSDPSNNEEWQDVLDNVSEGDFYLAVVKEKRPITDLDACIELDCGNQLGFYSYDTYFDPLDRSLVPTQTITFNVCGVPSGCTPAANSLCDKECSQGIDPDCATCTELAGDCCDISGDGVCDADCGEGVDPDCVCGKGRDGCCTGNCYDPSLDADDPEQGDPDCTACAEGTDCSSDAGDCCNFRPDTVCDPDCKSFPLSMDDNLSLEWNPDPDCCQGTSVQGASVIQGSGSEFATSEKDGCCKPECDGVCDDDCLAGLDPDCVDVEYRGSGCHYCGDGTCDYDEIFDVEHRNRLRRALRDYKDADPENFVSLFDDHRFDEPLEYMGISREELLDANMDDVAIAFEKTFVEGHDNCPEDCDEGEGLLR